MADQPRPDGLDLFDALGPPWKDSGAVDDLPVAMARIGRLCAALTLCREHARENLYLDPVAVKKHGHLREQKAALRRVLGGGSDG
jgi:hypothetical protein